MVSLPIDIHKPPDCSHSPLALLTDRDNQDVLLSVWAPFLVVTVQPSFFQILVVQNGQMYPTGTFFHSAPCFVGELALFPVQNTVFDAALEASADSLFDVDVGDFLVIVVLLRVLGEGYKGDCLCMFSTVICQI